MKVLPLILMLPLFCQANTKISDAKESITSLIAPLVGEIKKKNKFRVNNCQKEKINWGKILLSPMNEHPLHFKFTDACDVEGIIKIKAFEAFPADLKLRNLDSFTALHSKNKFALTFEAKPLLTLNILEGELSGKNRVRFKASYSVRLNPTSPKELNENLGGTITFTEINGKSVNVTEKIYIR